MVSVAVKRSLIMSHGSCKQIRLIHEEFDGCCPREIANTISARQKKCNKRRQAKNEIKKRLVYDSFSLIKLKQLEVRVERHKYLEIFKGKKFSI